MARIKKTIDTLIAKRILMLWHTMDETLIYRVVDGYYVELEDAKVFEFRVKHDNREIYVTYTNDSDANQVNTRWFSYHGNPYIQVLKSLTIELDTGRLEWRL